MLQTQLKLSILVIERAFRFPIIDQNQIANVKKEIKDHQSTS